MLLLFLLYLLCACALFGFLAGSWAVKHLVIGDLHFGHSGPVQESGYSERNEWCLETCRWIAAEVRKRRPERVIHLGDLNDSLNRIEISTLSAMTVGVTAIWHACRDVGALLILIPGNHDVTDHRGEQFVQHPFAQWPQVYIPCPGEPMAIVTEGVAYLPFYRDVAECDEAIRELPDEITTVYLHQELRGATYGTGATATAGISPAEHSGRRLIAGDIHVPQQVGENGWHPGAPLYHSWRDLWDSDDPRGIMLVGSRSVKRIPNPNPVMFHREEIPQWSEGSNLVQVDWIDHLARGKAGDSPRGRTLAGESEGDPARMRVWLTCHPDDADRWRRRWADSFGSLRVVPGEEEVTLAEDIEVCCECGEPAVWTMAAQFSGDHHFCPEHAEAQENFGVTDNSHFVWREIEQTRSFDPEALVEREVETAGAEFDRDTLREIGMEAVKC